MTKLKYRSINPNTDFGKIIEVRNSTNRSWTRGHKLELITTKSGHVISYTAGGKVWTYARIREEEAPPQEPPKSNPEIYLEVTKEDIGKEIEVLQPRNGVWKKGKLTAVDRHSEIMSYQVNGLWWWYARIRAETPNVPSQPSSPQEKPLQSHVDARFDCIDPVVLKLLAECLGYGAKKYYPYSYLRIPVEDHINHALNHINEHRRLGQDSTQKPEDELHLVNALARITFAISCLAQQGSYPDTYSHPEKQE